MCKILIKLTQVCNRCLIKKCSGGYNCKYGAADKKYQICTDDLFYGICHDLKCKCIHLTSRGLLPLSSHCNSYKALETITIDNSNSDINKINEIKRISNIGKSYFDLLNINLTDLNNSNQENECETDSIESVTRIMEYLNEDSESDKSCDESIFD